MPEYVPQNTEKSWQKSWEDSKIFNVEFNEENPFEWKMLLQGPKDSPYEYGLYHVTCKFPNNYPNYPPEVIFKSKIFPKNIINFFKSVINLVFFTITNLL